jgi:hypothetical protein
MKKILGDHFYPLLHMQYVVRSTFHTTLKATPGQLVFARDMVLPINFMADWGAIEQQRQKKMGRNNRR